MTWLTPHFTWREDLAWFDGPLLSVFTDTAGAPYLFQWVDLIDGKTDRWMIVPTTEEDIKALLNSTLPLRAALLLGADRFWTPGVVLFDTPVATRDHYMEFVLLEDVPVDCLPVAGEFLFR